MMAPRADSSDRFGADSGQLLYILLNVASRSRAAAHERQVSGKLKLARVSR
jgi:hypothetical protein